MDRSEQALASLLDPEESLLETWSVDTINRGFELSPPGMGGSETLGLTDRRLVWLDDELETVELGAVESIEPEAIAQSPTSMLRVVGSIAVVLGGIVSIALWLLTSVSPVLTLAPVGLGGLTLIGALVGARFGDTGDVDHQHYLEVKSLETTVQVYATESVVESMRERIADAVE